MFVLKMAVVMCLDAMAGFLSSGNQWVLHSGLVFVEGSCGWMVVGAVLGKC